MLLPVFAYQFHKGHAMEMNPDVLELVRRYTETGATPELIKSTEWSYTLKIGGKHSHRISRFMAEKDFEVSASDIQQRWKQWGQNERWDFASNWWCKPTWNHDDTEILEMIMSDGDDFIWSSCTQAFLKHPDRDRAVTFLIDRTLKSDFGHEPLNYIQVLGMSRDVRAIAAIRPYYEKYRRALEVESEIGVPDDVFFGPIPYSAYFSAAGALFKISGSSEYQTAIRKYFDHPSEQVRWWAEHALEVEGPTTAARNAKYEEERAKR
jgi:hypothetical protein